MPDQDRARRDRPGVVVEHRHRYVPILRRCDSAGEATEGASADSQAAEGRRPPNRASMRARVRPAARTDPRSRNPLLPQRVRRSSPSCSGPTIEMDVDMDNTAFCLGCCRVASRLTRDTREPRLPGALLLLQEAVGEDDLDDRCDGVLAGPVALQFDRERNPADRLPAACITRSRPARWAAARCRRSRRRRVDLIPFAQRVQRGKGHADFGPQGADDELAAAGGVHGLDEFDVLQEFVVVRSSGLSSCRAGRRARAGWAAPAGGDVDGRVHDRDLEGLDGPEGRTAFLTRRS